MTDVLLWIFAPIGAGVTAVIAVERFKARIDQIDAHRTRVHGRRP